MRKIITIAREFGAGGGEIGRRVAKELGIEYYDKDIILRTALADPKLTPEEVRKWDERVPQTFGFAQSLFDFYNKPLDEQLWQAQMDAIREMASHESCVIVGRNSEYILKEFDHCLRVFAHAGFQWRVNRMAGKMPGVSLEQVASDVRQADNSAGDGTYGYCLRVRRIYTAGILGQRAAAGIFPKHHCYRNGDYKYRGILPDTERGRSAEVQQR